MKQIKILMIMSALVLVSGAFLSLWQGKSLQEIQIGLVSAEKIYDDNLAASYRSSCEAVQGVWLESSKLYECEIGGDVWTRGEWELVDWNWYGKIKEACLILGGKFFGGSEMKCEIADETYYQGSWERLARLEASCQEYDGRWLGGSRLECEIDGVVYAGNWDYMPKWRESCILSKGVWLGTDTGKCRIGEYVYESTSWELLPKMAASCQESGGSFLAGPTFACQIGETIYENQEWVRVALVPTVGSKCQADGGSWLEDRNECQGVSLSWCEGLVKDFPNLGSLGYNQERSSCYY